MELQPMDSQMKPKYPTKKELLHHPHLLKPLPQRWMKNASTCAAAGMAVAMLFSGCTDNGANISQTAISTPSVLQTQPIPSVEAKPLKIPFFAHGEGHGSYGCVSVVPAVFFTEEEAYEVISQTAKEYGLDFSDKDKVYETKIPETSELSMYQSDNNNLKAEKGSISLDGYDKNKNIGFEFVSIDDIHAWEVEEVLPSVSAYDVYDTAKKLNGYFNEAGVPAAVFYEPCEEGSFNSDNNNYEDAWKKAEEETRIKAKQTLKAQVIDFMEWLKSQGII